MSKQPTTLAEAAARFFNVAPDYILPNANDGERIEFRWKIVGCPLNVADDTGMSRMIEWLRLNGRVRPEVQALWAGMSDGYFAIWARK